MRLTKKELTAMVCMAAAMAEADGKVEDDEVMAVVADLAGYGHSEEEIAEIIEMAEDMEPSEAIGLVSKLGDEEKEYVTAFLAVVMAADGDIDDEEVAFWNLMTILCDLPEMTVREAVDLWKRYNS
jgi:uncharacterized tellurite resistance protein B-like protein